MINISIKGRFEYDVSKIIGKAFSKEVMLELAALAKDLIYRRTKSGKGVDSSGNETTLKKLDDNYIEWRKKKQLGEDTSPSKSNATLTGSMLKAMDIKASSKEFTVFIKNSAREGSSLTNAQVAALYELTRTFLGLTTGEKRIITQRFEDILKKLL
jgi:hypothetical protein